MGQGAPSKRTTPASARVYSLQLYQSLPSKWSPAQQKAFLEHCDKSRVLDATSCGLPYDEILKLLEAFENHLLEVTKAKNRKGKKHKSTSAKSMSSIMSMTSSASSSSSSSTRDTTRITEFEGSDLRVLFMGKRPDVNNSKNDRKGKGKDEVTPSWHLYLSKNALKYFPRQICKPAEGLGSRLTHLNLSGNNIEYLPPSIRTLRLLEMLELSSNKLVSIPKEIGTLTSLTYLGLENNNIRYLPFQILSLGHSTLSITIDNNPWLEPGQLYHINECLRYRALSSNEANANRAVPAQEAAAEEGAEQPRERLLVDSRRIPRPSPSLMHLCVKAVEKYDICWEALAECIPTDIQSILIAGARLCDSCRRPLDSNLRPQIALIHFQKSAFGNSQPLPFLYSICSAECSRFILIASCLFEFLRRTPGQQEHDGAQ